MIPRVYGLFSRKKQVSFSQIAWAVFSIEGGFEPGVTHQLQPDFEKSPAFFMPISRIVEFSALIPEKFNQQKLRGRFVCIDRYMQSDLFFISAEKGGNMRQIYFRARDAP